MNNWSASEQTSASKREPGYYRVKLKPLKGAIWIIALYRSHGRWVDPAYPQTVADEYWEQIDEHRIDAVPSPQQQPEGDTAKLTEYLQRQLKQAQSDITFLLRKQEEMKEEATRLDDVTEENITELTERTIHLENALNESLRVVSDMDENEQSVLVYEIITQALKNQFKSLSRWKEIAIDGLPGIDTKDDQQIMLANTHRGFTYKWGTIKTTAEQLARYSQFTHWRQIELPIITP